MEEQFTDIPWKCCREKEWEPGDACVCGQTGMAIRRFMDGNAPRAMTPEERTYFIADADRLGEGYYSREELEKEDDRGLAYHWLNACRMYVQSNCDF